MSSFDVTPPTYNETITDDLIESITRQLESKLLASFKPQIDQLQQQVNRLQHQVDELQDEKVVSKIQFDDQANNLALLTKTITELKKMNNLSVSHQNNNDVVDQVKYHDAKINHTDTVVDSTINNDITKMKQDIEWLSSIIEEVNLPGSITTLQDDVKQLQEKDILTNKRVTRHQAQIESLDDLQYNNDNDIGSIDHGTVKLNVDDHELYTQLIANEKAMNDHYVSLDTPHLQIEFFEHTINKPRITLSCHDWFNTALDTFIYTDVLGEALKDYFTPTEIDHIKASNLYVSLPIPINKDHIQSHIRTIKGTQFLQIQGGNTLDISQHRLYQFLSPSNVEPRNGVLECMPNCHYCRGQGHDDDRTLHFHRIKFIWFP